MAQLPDTLWAALEMQAQLFPDKIAYRVLGNTLAERESVTFSELLHRAEGKALQLMRRGFTGRPIILFQPTGLDFIVTFFAVLRGGGSVIPLNSRFLLRGGEDLKPILADVAPAALLSDQVTAERFQRSAREDGSSIRLDVLPPAESLSWRREDLDPAAAQPSSVAVIQYTSGSTSAPKGVCVTHANLLANARILTRIFEANPEDVAVSWLPFFHDMGLMTGLVWPVTEGASSVLMKPSTFAARPHAWLKAMSSYKGTISAGPNFAYQLCADRMTAEDAAQLDLSSWRVAICGAEPVNPATVEGFLDKLAAARFDTRCFYPSYGLAEATLFVSGGRPNAPPRILEIDAHALERQGAAEAPGTTGKVRRLTSCGRPAPNLRVAIVDPDTLRAVPDRHVGEIWISGPSVAAGYLGHHDLNRDVFGAMIAGDGEASTFLRTGDLGFFDSDELIVVGRLKDLLIVRGAKYAPQDLEITCEQAHAGLEGCRGAVFAIEDQQDGGIVVVHETQAPAAEADVIISALRSRIAEVHGVTLHAVSLLPPNTLPLTSSGKVRRAPLRSTWLAGGLKAVADWRASDLVKSTAESTAP